MSVDGRIQSLQARHSRLENSLSMEERRPYPDIEVLKRIKVEKLNVKDEIERFIEKLA